MKPVEGAHHEHFLPFEYQTDGYRIVLTRAILRGSSNYQGREVLRNTVGLKALLEARIDLSKGRVTAVEDPTKRTVYEGIPVPVF